MLIFKLKLVLGTFVFVMLIDAYLWQGVKRLLHKKRIARQQLVKRLFWAVPWIFILGSVCYLLVPLLETSTLFRNYFMASLATVYFSKLIALPFLLGDDIRRLMVWTTRKLKRTAAPHAQASSEENPEHKISRSTFITQTGIIAGGIPFIMLTKGMIKGAYDYRVRHETLYLPKLPDYFDSLRIVQISDVHSGSFFDKDAVKKGIDLIMQQKADLVFFTGDMVNNKTDEVHDYTDIFGHIKAPMGVFSTLGNHDYGDYVTNWKSDEEKAKNLSDLCDVHRSLGWNLMRNAHEVISVHGQKLALLGVENWGDRGRFQKFGDVNKAKQGMEEAPVKLLLSHDPSHWDAIVRPEHPDVDVMFSGHTHGMQFGVEIGSFKWSPSQYIYKQWAGLYKEGKQQLYVNRGFGFIGYPGRVGILPEITVFTLKKA